MTTKLVMDVVTHDGASAGLAHIGRSVDSNSSKWKKMGAAVKVAAKATAVGLLAGAVALGGFAKGAAEDQLATKQLSVAMVNNADATKGQQAAVERWITSVGKSKGIADDVLRPALTRLVTATHSVTKAQDLARLGMNIAAGTGKDLSTVTAALAKAQLGSVGGLSKLGVATKDAAGKTMDFDTIQKNLAQTFKGQAATAAHTASGEYNRLKVMLSETGESIGYKLLPFATKLGDWILNKGVPAAQALSGELRDKLSPDVQKLSHWFSENKDELKQFAETAGGDALTALQTLGDVTGKLVGWFSKLPGPVKSLAGEAAIAAIVIPKLTGALAGMKLSEFITNMRGAETRTIALGVAARNAAGIAGLGALIDSTHRTGTALGDLETIGGAAATGFSMGGPWGALIGGAGGGLIVALKHLKGATHDADEVFTDGKQPVADYASTLDDLTGKVTALTRQTITNQLATSGALSAARDFGISQRTVVQAVLGNKDALADVNSMLAKAKTLTIAYTDQWGASYSMQVKNQTQLKKTVASLTAQGYSIDSVAKKQLDLAGQKALLDFIGKQTSEWKAESKETRDHILAAEDLSAVYKAFPKKVSSAIDATGVVPTAKGVADLAVKYDAVDKRHLKALIEATGTDITVKQVQSVIDHMAYLAAHNKVTVTTQYNYVGLKDPTRGRDPLSRTSDRSGGGGNLGAAGLALIRSLVAGISKGKTPATKVLDAVTAAFQARVDKWKDLLAQSKDFADSFKGWASSVFSMAGTNDDGTPLTVEQMLAKARGETATSGQVNTDVQKLISEGLSSDLIQQLKDQGASGIAALHALASATQDQINELNADNAQTQANYAAAGVAAANQVYAGDIAQAAASKDVAATLLDVIQGFKNLKNVEFTIKGSDLVAVIDKDKKNKGKK